MKSNLARVSSSSWIHPVSDPDFRSTLVRRVAMWVRYCLRLSSKVSGVNNDRSLNLVSRIVPKPRCDGGFSRPYSTASTGGPVGFSQSGAGAMYGGTREAQSLAVEVSGAFKAMGTMEVANHYGRCFWELSKARLSMLVVATSGTGYILGSGSSIDYLGLCCTCAGTMMVAASANSLNQVFEVKNDAKMNRTKNRPLPSGRISVQQAVTWASSVGLAGTALLAFQTNTLAASLAASNLFLYAFVYTPLKQIHPINTWVGAIVGAIPPALGWAAAAGDISVNGMILPAALYFWQIPHFMALAYLCRDDYAKGGFKMFSLGDPTGRRTALVALRNCVYLLPLGYLAYDWGLASGWFCAESSLLALAISSTAAGFFVNRTSKSARRMFHASLLYLPVFMGGLLVHRVVSDDQELEETISSSLSQKEDYEHGEVVTMPIRERRPPVAYASVAPFPFLPAPSYGSW